MSTRKQLWITAASGRRLRYATRTQGQAFGCYGVLLVGDTAVWVGPDRPYGFDAACVADAQAAAERL